MENFLLILLIFSSALFILHTVFGLLGLADIDLDIDLESSTGDGVTGFLTIRNFITFLLGFSAAGYLVLKQTGFQSLALIAGVLFGGGLSYSIVHVMRLFKRLEQHNEVQPYQYRGLEATVTIKIDEGRSSIGKVEFVLNGRVDEMQAITDDDESFTRGDLVHVIKVLENGVLLVEKPKIIY